MKLQLDPQEQKELSILIDTALREKKGDVEILARINHRLTRF